MLSAQIVTVLYRSLAWILAVYWLLPTAAFGQTTAVASGILKYSIDSNGNMTFSLAPGNYIELGGKIFAVSTPLSEPEPGMRIEPPGGYRPPVKNILNDPKFTKFAVDSARMQIQVASALSDFNLKDDVRVEKVFSDKGKMAGLWISPDSPEASMQFAKGLPETWQKVQVVKGHQIDWAGSLAPGASPVRNTEETTKVVRDQLFSMAKIIGCSKPPPPNPDKVSIAADIPSTNIGKAGPGNLKISLEWSTKELCDPAKQGSK